MRTSGLRLLTLIVAAISSTACSGSSRSGSGGATTAGATSGTAATTSGAGGNGGSTTGGSTPAKVTALPLPSGAVGGPRARGIDVSYYQGTIDWAQVAGAGISFGITRVSDGLTFQDPQFRRNWDTMKARGLVRGVYQFFRPGQDPVQQADALLAQIDAAGGFGPGDLPPVCDLEVRDGRTAAQINAATAAWLARIEARTGLHGLIYTSPGFWNPLGAPSYEETNDLWVAHWGVNTPLVPNSWREWTFWQTSATGRVAGIAGDVDTDLYHGDRDDLRAYAAERLPGYFRGLACDSTGQGYWVMGKTGGVLPFGDATFRGTAGGARHPEPFIGILRTPRGLGYWLYRADGVVVGFGDAAHHGDRAAAGVSAPVTAMAATSTGQGYWLFTRDGQVHAFGDARALGGPTSPGNEVVAAAATPSGMGYRVVDADGVVHPFGDASPEGDLSGRALTSPVTGIAGTPSGRGYWLVQADGTVSAFGDAPALTYAGNRSTSAPVVAIEPTLTGRGYWLLADDGVVFPVGDAVDAGLRAR